MKFLVQNPCTIAKNGLSLKPQDDAHSAAGKPVHTISFGGEHEKTFYIG
jgi:hypothetical protein